MRAVALIDRLKQPNEIIPCERSTEADPSQRSCSPQGFDKAAVSDLADRAAASSGISGLEEATTFLQSWIKDRSWLISDSDWLALPQAGFQTMRHEDCF